MTTPAIVRVANSTLLGTQYFLASLRCHSRAFIFYDDHALTAVRLATS